MKFAIIGCGLVGEKRAEAIVKNHHLAAVADCRQERADHLASKYSAAPYHDWQQMLDDHRPQAVVVAVTNDQLAAIGTAAVRAGCHVLIEKPGGTCGRQLAELAAAGRQNRRVVKIGYNLRFHPAIARARIMVERGAVGDLMFVRGRYGHGGRPGYETEWRFQPHQSGGGELIDQGVHLIDLARWLLGDLTVIEGVTASYFWPAAAEDNAFMLLANRDRRVAFLQASCTEWKNLFSLEIYGRTGKLQVDGLGGSYGPERLTWYRMRPEMGPPDTLSWEFPPPDRSWQAEIDHFVDCIQTGRPPLSGPDEGRAVMELVDHIYRRNQQ
ncbi:MAG: Gfo/Idh/MocA family oxidoreductase [Negativicutes bacterium]|nr:Gfo/Idh/MocA family oxidoreductase [Negativicutes bacterium]